MILSEPSYCTNTKKLVVREKTLHVTSFVFRTNCSPIGRQEVVTALCFVLRSRKREKHVQCEYSISITQTRNCGIVALSF